MGLICSSPIFPLEWSTQSNEILSIYIYVYYRT